MLKSFVLYVLGGNEKPASLASELKWEHYDLISKHVLEGLSAQLQAQDAVAPVDSSALLSEAHESLQLKKDEYTTGPSISDKTLFCRLGGFAAIQKVVVEMYMRIFADEELKDFFKKTNKAKQKRRQAWFICYATGGSKVWIGPSMMAAHKGRGISAYHFDKTVFHIIHSMRALGIPQRLEQEMNDLLYTLRGDCHD